MLIARLLLSAVFAVAAVAKLADLPGSRQALIGFGVSGRLANPLGTLLPLVELAVAVALVPTSTAAAGAVGGMVLLLIFSAGIATNIALKREAECHCFGQLHSGLAGWPTLARNVALAALAGLLVWKGFADPGPSAVAWVAGLPTPELVALLFAVVVLALVACAAWVSLQLLKQHGRILNRLEALEAALAGHGFVAWAAEEPFTGVVQGLPVGADAPSFNLADLDGTAHTLSYLRAAGRPVMLIFTDPGCGPCKTLLPEVARWQKEHAAELTISLLSNGSVEETRAEAERWGLRNVLVQPGAEVADAYQVTGTPGAVLVTQDGRVASAVAFGAGAIQALVAETVSSPDARVAQIEAVHKGASATQMVGLTIGTPAPALELEDLDGQKIELDDFRGEEVLVLLWNPGCGFCRSMLDDLRTWELDPPAGAPQVLVVSTADAEANRSMGLLSPVLIDQGFVAGQAFGARGTPTAVLVDAEGNIASQLAVGASAVFALARQAQRMVPAGERQS